MNARDFELKKCWNCNEPFLSKKEREHFCSDLCRPESRRRKALYYKSWYEKNKARKQAVNKVYQKKHEAYLKYFRQLWQKQNKDKVRFSNLASNHKRRGAVGSHTLQQWKDLKAIYGFRCAMCGVHESISALTQDHKIPLIKGGTNYIDNIQPLCQSCNSRKHTKIWFASCPVDYLKPSSYLSQE